MAYQIEEQDYISWIGRRIGLSGAQAEIVTTPVEGFVGDNIERVMPALFGVWEIELLHGPGQPMNAGLDFQRSDTVVLTFSGRAQAFSSARR